MAARRSPGRHAAGCLRCQAEEARYRTMLRGLRDLRDREAQAPPYLAAGVMGALDEPALEAPRPARTAAVAIAGGTAVAIAAAAAIAGIRHRRAA